MARKPLIINVVKIETAEVGFDCAREERERWTRHFEQQGFANWLGGGVGSWSKRNPVSRRITQHLACLGRQSGQQARNFGLKLKA
jgi:hypothetical protein